MPKKLTKYSDAELVAMMENSGKQKQEAFTEIYNRYSSKVHAYCVCVVKGREQAEDIFQEVFIRFYRKIDPKHIGTNVPAYLMVVARNLCMNYFRDKKQTVDIEDFEFSELQKSYENKELFEIILSTLDFLSDILKEAFILREIDGLSYEEIAQICNTTLSNAKSRVSRAREKLIELLQPYIKDIENNTK